MAPMAEPASAEKAEIVAGSIIIDLCMFHPSGEERVDPSG